MLQDVPLNAYLICYGPLVLTVLGFIFFAGLTDGDARRTYLRRLKSREDQPPKERLTAETPAGVSVTIDRTAEGGTSVQVGDTPPPTTQKKTEVEAVAEFVEGDDLTKIEGIGPKMSQALVAAGIDTFEKLAAASEDDLRAAIEAADMRLAPSLVTWAKQAAFAAKGDWVGLQAYQDTLDAGRPPE